MELNAEPKGLLSYLKRRSHNADVEAHVRLLERDSYATLLDIGCGMGFNTVLYRERIGTPFVTGIDAHEWGDVPFGFVKQNIDDGLPFSDESFDVITSYHVIEHVSDTDLFVKEIHRVLKPGGYAVIGTPNLASGQVILELLFNKQPSVAYVSDHFRIRGGTAENWRKSEGNLHRRLFTLEGLCGLFKYYNFTIEKAQRTGYGPGFFFAPLLRGLYAGNLVVKVRKTREEKDE